MKIFGISESALISFFVVLAYFSGFVYINEYYRFFGLTQFYIHFSPLYLGFFAYYVLLELILFRDCAASARFIFLIILLIAVLRRHNIQILRSWRYSVCLDCIIGTIFWGSIPYRLRLLLAIVASFVVMFNVSGRIGYLHGLQKLMKTDGGFHLLDANFDKLSDEDSTMILGLSRCNQLIDLWIDENITYIGSKISGPECPRRTIIWDRQHSSFSIIEITPVSPKDQEGFKKCVSTQFPDR